MMFGRNKEEFNNSSQPRFPAVVSLLQEGGQQGNLMSNWCYELWSTSQSRGEAGKKELVQLHGRLWVVPGQQADQCLHGAPRSGSTLFQVVLQQLLDKAERMQIRSCCLSGGNRPQQSEAMLNAGGDTPIAGSRSSANPQASNSTA